MDEIQIKILAYDEGISHEIEKLVQYVFSQNLIQPLTATIETTDNIAKRRVELMRDNGYDKALISYSQDNSNGCVVLPCDIELPINVLVAEHTFQQKSENEFYQFISTIPHELTHAQDFFSFVVSKNDSNYLTVFYHPDYGSFRAWTEYRARMNGCIVFNEYINNFIIPPMTKEDKISSVINYEIPAHTESLKQGLKEYRKDAYHCQYMLVHFLGRFSAWERLYPSAGTNNYLIQNRELSALYALLNNNTTFKEMSSQFGILESLLNDCVQSMLSNT